jgi:hypothetical protein
MTSNPAATQEQRRNSYSTGRAKHKPDEQHQSGNALGFNLSNQKLRRRSPLGYRGKPLTALLEISGQETDDGEEAKEAKRNSPPNQDEETNTDNNTGKV